MEPLSPQFLHRLVFTVLMHGLDESQHESALKLLTDARFHPMVQIRELAVVAIAEMEIPPARRIESLLPSMVDQAPSVRRRAARALGDLVPHSHPALRHLINGLADADASVRRECAGAIGRLGSKAAPACPHLVWLLGEPEPRTRAIVGSALKRIGKASLPALFEGAKMKDPQLSRSCLLLVRRMAAEYIEASMFLSENAHLFVAKQSKTPSPSLEASVPMANASGLN